MEYVVITHGPVVEVTGDEYQIENGILHIVEKEEKVCSFNSWIAIKKKTDANNIINLTAEKEE